MNRASVSAQCDAVASYMDGVHVKIAEAYKPPRKVCLPAAYNNRLPNVSRLTYEFALERAVLEKMTEWSNVREADKKARQVRLDEKRKKEEEESPPPPPPPPPPDSVKQMPVTAPAPEQTILKPQPLSPPANDLRDNVKTNGLDYADFDNDTSSPFDNMELKTINDMEELALVLQPVSQWAAPAKLENILNEMTVEEKSEVHQEERKSEPAKGQSGDQEEKVEKEDVKHRSVSTIMEELHRELERPFMENWNPWPNLESPETSIPKPEDSGKPSREDPTDEDLLIDLTEEDRKFARHLNDMGFPLSRAARAIRDLGGQDNKKVVEFLLIVQTLEETGIPGDVAEKALTLTHYDPDKAKTYYHNLRTLKDLGFPEDKASAALLKCDLDRDKALDDLIA